MNVSPLNLCDLLAPSAIQLNLSGKHREEVLRELVTLIPHLHNRPEERETLARALLEREQLHSTGIGDGVAFPHARNAMIGLVERPVIALGRHPAGIQFGAIDGRPTQLFFLLVAPTVTTHLAVLARISRLLRDAKLRQGLLLADRPEKALALLREAEARM